MTHMYESTRITQCSMRYFPLEPCTVPTDLPKRNETEPGVTQLAYRAGIGRYSLIGKLCQSCYNDL